MWSFILMLTKTVCRLAVSSKELRQLLHQIWRWSNMVAKHYPVIPGYQLLLVLPQWNNPFFYQHQPARRYLYVCNATLPTWHFRNYTTRCWYYVYPWLSLHIETGSLHLTARWKIVPYSLLRMSISELIILPFGITLITRPDITIICIPQSK